MEGLVYIYIYIYIYIYTRHAGHCWRSRDELIRDVLLWTPTHGRAKAGRPARTYIQQLCEDSGCCPEDLPRAMNDREEWRERVRDIRATSAIWWWYWDRIWNADCLIEELNSFYRVRFQRLWPLHLPTFLECVRQALSGDCRLAVRMIKSQLDMRKKKNCLED